MLEIVWEVVKVAYEGGYQVQDNGVKDEVANQPLLPLLCVAAVLFNPLDILQAPEKGKVMVLLISLVHKNYRSICYLTCLQYTSNWHLSS